MRDRRGAKLSISQTATGQTTFSLPLAPTESGAYLPRQLCSAGIAAGLDMSLHVVAKLLGQEIAGKTARQMEYP